MMTRQFIGLLLGPAVFLALLLSPAPAQMPEHGMAVAAVAALMAVWWITEAIPIPATALLPIALFPLLGIMKTQQLTPAYANHLIYLFLGGFLIAATMQKWQLHKRIALYTVRLVGVSPGRIVLGFMVATAFLSMWISNTATAMMMLTIGLAVTKQTRTLAGKDENGDASKPFPFATALMLGIAYAASIGGVATLIGTPPNAILAGIMEKTYNIHIGFAQWMLFALPLSLIMLSATWWYLTRIACPMDMHELPGGRQTIENELARLGPIKREEKLVLAVFVLVVAGWIVPAFIRIDWMASASDATIAMFGALVLFIVPVNIKKGEFLLDWRTAVGIPWDIIILFGGGFALAQGFSDSGLTKWIAEQLIFLHGMNTWILVGAICLTVVFLTEVTSNTATASLLIPVMGAFAMSLDISPLTTAVAVAVSASYAFMLPVATPPNAIIFSSREVTVPQMAKAGLLLNLLGTVVITVFIQMVLPLIFEIVS